MEQNIEKRNIFYSPKKLPTRGMKAPVNTPVLFASPLPPLPTPSPLKSSDLGRSTPIRVYECDLDDALKKCCTPEGVDANDLRRRLRSISYKDEFTDVDTDKQRDFDNLLHELNEFADSLRSVNKRLQF